MCFDDDIFYVQSLSSPELANYQRGVRIFAFRKVRSKNLKFFNSFDIH